MKKETKEIYTCDRCGKEYDDKYGEHVPIIVEGVSSYDEADLCYDCMQELTPLVNKACVRVIREFCGLDPDTEDYFPHKQPPKSNLTKEELLNLYCESSRPTRY